MDSQKKPLYHYVILTVVILAGLTFRLWGIGFGLPLKYARPDEDQIVESALYLFTGDYNPHFYYYPHIFIYLNHIIYRIIYYAGLLSGVYAEKGDFLKNFILAPSIFFYAARFISAIAGTLTIWFTYITARRFYDSKVALFSSALLSFAFLHIRDSHFGTTDICFTAAILLTAYYSHDLMTKGKGYISAAIAGGIAAGFKYNGALSSIFIFLAHVIYNIKSGNGLKRVFLDIRLYISGALMTAVFIATSPGLIADFSKFLNRITFMAQWIAKGVEVNDVIGWAFYLKTSLLSGIGIPFLVLAATGILYALFRHGKEDILILSFPLIYFISIGDGYGVFSRYMIPLIPFLSIYAGRLLRYISSPESVFGKKGKAVALAFLIIALIPNISKSVQFDILCSKEDTRVEARHWIETNIPTGSRIFMLGNYIYNLPYLDMGKKSLEREVNLLEKASKGKNRYRLYLLAYDYILSNDIVPSTGTYEYIIGNHFSEEDIEKYDAEYFVTGEGFLKFYSGKSETVAPLLEKRFRLIKTFSPLSGNIEKPEKAVFDPIDAFYLPLSGFGEFERPGTVIKIYALKKE